MEKFPQELLFKENIKYPLLLLYIERGWLTGSKQLLDRIIKLIKDVPLTKPTLKISNRTISYRELVNHFWNLQWYHIAYVLATTARSRNETAFSDIKILAFLYDTVERPYWADVFREHFARDHPTIYTNEGARSVHQNTLISELSVQNHIAQYYLSLGYLRGNIQQLNRIIRLIEEAEPVTVVDEESIAILDDGTIYDGGFEYCLSNLEWYQIAYVLEQIVDLIPPPSDKELLDLLYLTYRHPYQSYDFCRKLCQHYDI